MSLKSLVQSGTKVWLDSIDPELIAKNRAQGATGATSNPIIIADLLKSGRFDDDIRVFLKQGKKDDEIAWLMTDKLVANAQDVFFLVWEKTKGNDGYVSFELDPLIEEPSNPMHHMDKVRRYVELGKKWSRIETHPNPNRMIKVPATSCGLDALEPLAAAGLALNVTLIFSMRQYEAARNAIWRGAQARPGGPSGGISGRAFKSVYSIFVSRVDVYTEKKVPELSPEAQGQVGIVNAKRMWRSNLAFWKDKNLPLQQEMIFASTGTKKPTDAPDKYVAALAGADIQTNPPATNEAVEKSPVPYTRMVDQMPSKAILDDIDAKVDQNKMEATLMEEGIAKFADPQHALLKLIAEKRAAIAH